MGKMYIVFVCHVETDWWDCGWASLKLGFPVMIELFKKVEKRTKQKVPVTYCLTPPAAMQYTDLFKQLYMEGNEIGVHSQWGTDRYPEMHDPQYEEDENGILNQDRCIPFMAKKLVELGFPPPKTNVGGNFAFRETTLPILEEFGFKVDCNVWPSAGKHFDEKSGILLWDFTQRKSYLPYHPSYENVCLEGDSKIIEIPCSIGFVHLKKSEDYVIQLRSFRGRWEERDKVKVDIYQIYWHFFETIKPQRKLKKEEHYEIDWDYIQGIERFLCEIGSWDDVIFATAYEAAIGWKKHHG